MTEKPPVDVHLDTRTGIELRVRQALQWVEQKLREDGGPHKGSSAVLVVTARPLPEDAQNAFLQVVCLPDIDHTALAEAVRRWAEDLSAGNIEQAPHGLPSEPEGPSDETLQ